jgi:HSP20 family protein
MRYDVERINLKFNESKQQENTMTKVVFKNRTLPMLDRDSFLTPFDKMFDQIVSAQFPEMTKSVGVNPMQGTAYPKVNVYEYDDKVGVVAEIPGLDKKDLSIDVEDGILTIAGNKHGLFDDAGAKVIRRELKQSSFKRQFELGELLDGKKIKASFKDGLLSIQIPKVEPAKPEKHSVKIS